VLTRLLIEKGADLGARCSTGFTPLHHAVSGGNEVLARLLIEKGVVFAVALA
jgi:ankyrin repeat protein